MRDRENTLRLVRHHLADIGRTGTLELRTERGRTPSYCVRFRYLCPATGTVRQHRLAIGDDPELHDVVRSAIMDRVRQRWRTKAEKAEAAQRRKKAQAAEAAFMADYPVSRRQRRFVRRAYRVSLATGQHFAVALCLISASPTRPKRPGRPLKSRLW